MKDLKFPKLWRAWVGCGGFFLLFIIMSLKLGAVDEASWNIISELRIPRIILAMSVGAALSVCGVVLQTLFSNPLCEPYTIGIASGSALGAVLGAAMGGVLDFYGISGFGFIGALCFTAVLSLLASRKKIHGSTLLLVGVLLSFVGTGLLSLCLALSEQNGLQTAISWLLGDLSRVRLQGAVTVFSVVSLGITTIWLSSRRLDSLLLGSELSLSLGIDGRKLGQSMIILLSVLIGTVVSASGMIGFVGLIVPFFARRWAGSMHGRVIPLSALLGSVVLLGADLISRLLIRPDELPVGVVTSLMGAPFFLWIVLEGQASAQKARR